MTDKIPAVVGHHLDAIHCTADDKVILASSDLTGRYWNGSLWCFTDVDDAPNVENCTAGVELSNGVCDIVVYNNDKVAVGLDSGALEFYQLNPENTNFSLLFSATEHDDFITSLDITCDKSHLVTAGADKCVKVWNMENWCSTYTLRPVHAGTVWQVACSLQDPEIFLTCGQDGKLLLLDSRLPRPATVLDTSPLKGEITSVTWSPSNPSQVAVGDESGNVAIKDTRNNNTLYSWEVHKRRIFRMMFSNCHPWLATCADDNNVHVSDLEKEDPTVIYKDARHNDFVRGLSWNSKNDLISCAWDKRVLRHVVSKMDV